MVDEQTQTLIALVRTGLSGEQAAETVKQETRAITELIRSGLSGQQAAEVIKALQLLRGMPAAAAAASASASASRTNGRSETVKSIVEQVVGDHDAAEVGTVWKIDLSRLRAATRHSKYKSGQRTDKGCRDAVRHVFYLRNPFEQNVDVSTDRKTDVLVLTRVTAFPRRRWNT